MILFVPTGNFLFFNWQKLQLSKEKWGGGVRKKRKEFVVARLAINLVTRWTGNKLFFKGGLT